METYMIFAGAVLLISIALIPTIMFIVDLSKIKPATDNLARIREIKEVELLDKFING